MVVMYAMVVRMIIVCALAGSITAQKFIKYRAPKPTPPPVSRPRTLPDLDPVHPRPNVDPPSSSKPPEDPPETKDPVTIRNPDGSSAKMSKSKQKCSKAYVSCNTDQDVCSNSLCGSGVPCLTGKTCLACGQCNAERCLVVVCVDFEEKALLKEALKFGKDIVVEAFRNDDAVTEEDYCYVPDSNGDTGTLQKGSCEESKLLFLLFLLAIPVLVIIGILIYCYRKKRDKPNYDNRGRAMAGLYSPPNTPSC